MNWGVIAIIVIFQPELRRGLEQLGTNKFTKFFGLDSDLATKTKEDIYKVVIADVYKRQHQKIFLIYDILHNIFLFLPKS